MFSLVDDARTAAPDDRLQQVAGERVADNRKLRHNHLSNRIAAQPRYLDGDLTVHPTRIAK